jgi:cholesterol transport system auxiliary component
MKIPLRFSPIMSIALLALMLAGCSITKPPTSATLFDLGPLRTSGPPPAKLPSISVAEIQAPNWLDRDSIYFRLTYVNEQQPRPYASSRWTMAPASLFGQRLKSQIALAGGVVLSATDGAANIPLLRLEADDFTQTFTTPEASFAQVAMRASLFNGRTLVTQKTFVRQSPAPTADAPGGVRALADASDAVIADIIAWLKQMTIK